MILKALPFLLLITLDADAQQNRRKSGGARQVRSAPAKETPTPSPATTQPTRPAASAPGSSIINDYNCDYYYMNCMNTTCSDPEIGKCICYEDQVINNPATNPRFFDVGGGNRVRAGFDLLHFTKERCTNIVAQCADRRRDIMLKYDNSIRRDCLTLSNIFAEQRKSLGDELTDLRNCLYAPCLPFIRGQGENFRAPEFSLCFQQHILESRIDMFCSDIVADSSSPAALVDLLKKEFDLKREMSCTRMHGRISPDRKTCTLTVAYGPSKNNIQARKEFPVGEIVLCRASAFGIRQSRTEDFEISKRMQHYQTQGTTLRIAGTVASVVVGLGGPSGIAALGENLAAGAGTAALGETIAGRVVDVVIDQTVNISIQAGINATLAIGEQALTNVALEGDAKIAAERHDHQMAAAFRAQKASIGDMAKTAAWSTMGPLITASWGLYQSIQTVDDYNKMIADMKKECKAQNPGDHEGEKDCLESVKIMERMGYMNLFNLGLSAYTASSAAWSTTQGLRAAIGYDAAQAAQFNAQQEFDAANREFSEVNTPELQNKLDADISELRRLMAPDSGATPEAIAAAEQNIRNNPLSKAEGNRSSKLEALDKAQNNFKTILERVGKASDSDARRTKEERAADAAVKTAVAQAELDALPAGADKKTRNAAQKKLRDARRAERSLVHADTRTLVSTLLGATAKLATTEVARFYDAEIERIAEQHAEMGLGNLMGDLRVDRHGDATGQAVEGNNNRTRGNCFVNGEWFATENEAPVLLWTL
ncbi:MAG: hypothetical protein FWD15_03530 [Alphaproteobacteria bacterium]|nr:hypothetical protein [Alphaproteobacteria bacterium]